MNSPLQIIRTRFGSNQQRPNLMGVVQRLYRMMGEYELALVDHGKAIALEPDNIRRYRERASTYRMMGEYELALADHTGSDPD